MISGYQNLLFYCFNVDYHKNMGWSSHERVRKTRNDGQLCIIKISNIIAWHGMIVFAFYGTIKFGLYFK